LAGEPTIVKPTLAKVGLALQRTSRQSLDHHGKQPTQANQRRTARRQAAREFAPPAEENTADTAGDSAPAALPKDGAKS
jgi:hypothetical protein